MSEVLDRLRDIELEVLARIENPKAAEHVGSVKLLRHNGPRAMPIFAPLSPLPTAAITTVKGTSLEDDTDGDDEHVETMEEEALATLNALDIDGSGASDLPSAYSTCRTARWEDRVSIIEADSSTDDIRELPEGVVMMLTQAVHPSGSDPSPSTASSFSATRSERPDPPTGEQMQHAPQFTEPSTNQAQDGVQGDIEAAMESTLTIRGDASLKESDGPDVFPAEPAQEVSDQVEPTLDSKPPADKLMTKHQRGEFQDKEDLDKIRRGAVGTHRFTLVDKEPAQIIGGKKASSCKCRSPISKLLLADSHQFRPISHSLSFKEDLRQLRDAQSVRSAWDNDRL